MVPGQLQPGADQNVVSVAPDTDDVVRDEAMPSFDQIENALALADAASAHEQQTDAIDVG